MNYYCVLNTSSGTYQLKRISLTNDMSRRFGRNSLSGFSKTHQLTKEQYEDLQLIRRKEGLGYRKLMDKLQEYGLVNQVATTRNRRPTPQPSQEPSWSEYAMIAQNWAPITFTATMDSTSGWVNLQ